jgi:hypothetical protein
MGLLSALLFSLAPISFAMPADHDHVRHRHDFVDALNSISGNSTWSAALNARFYGTPIGASKAMCGVKPDSLDEFRSAVAAGKIKLYTKAMLGNVDIPDAFDSAETWPQCAKVINDIRDQVRLSLPGSHAANGSARVGHWHMHCLFHLSLPCAE